MRLCSYSVGDAPRWGYVIDEDIVDGEMVSGIASVRELLRRGALGPPPVTEPHHTLGDVRLLPPVLGSEKIIGIGVNYADRNEEYRETTPAPYPSVFLRTPDSLVGHESPILRPPESEQLDYEGEIVIVIGKPGRRIEPIDAADHIAGLTIMNDGSVRDWLRHAKFNVTQGKNFVASGSLGPWLVTSDEVPGFDDLKLETRVNGEVRQHDTTANLIFSFEELIAYLSTFFHLKPGDLIATGTPTGAGARFDPPRWLRPGDVIEVEVGGIGVLRNTVADEHP